VKLKFWASTALVAICVVPFACGGGNEEVKTITLQGAGASFPYPIYDAWFKAYNEQDGVDSDQLHQATGSGAGIKAASSTKQVELRGQRCRDEGLRDRQGQEAAPSCCPMTAG
jgi:ABC-type phosphate transport system substrate-binding protein